MAATQVLIVGAGPTGLNLALRLAHDGIAIRIIDKASGPGQASRAMAVHARTLEFYRQLGFADEMVAQGIPIDAMHLRGGGKDIARVSFKDIGTGLSPYPFVMSYPQDDHERFLIAKLEAAGVPVEWSVALAHLSQTNDRVEATLSHEKGEDTCEATYVCGCDGGHSRVREEVKLGFPGGDYPNRFYVIDAKLHGDFDTDGAMTLGDEIFALKLPVRSRGMHRLIGVVPPVLADRKDLSVDDIAPLAENLLGARIESVNWFSTYHSHHRVAAHFRVGRCFVAGDAGHVHSPAGGQGMNTGIGDAVNLAWKLSAVLRGRADPAILDTYESERIAFARKLVATTDRAFNVPIRAGLSGRFLRRVVLPYVMPSLFRIERLRRLLFKTVSQTRISYRETSVLSVGRAGCLAGGDRLAWLAQDGGDNFAPLSSLDWQLHVYGVGNASLRSAASHISLPVYDFAWSGTAASAGFARDAAYLVRPDGHVGLALPDQDAKSLDAYVARHGLRFAA